MFPRLSDIINYFLGTDIALPIQTYGMMVALAFISAAYILYLELKRKEKSGIFKSQVQEITIGKPATIVEILTSTIISFFIGFKLGAAFTDYDALVVNPQTFILSWEGNLPLGILFGVASGVWTWYDKHRKKLPTPKKEKITVYPKDLAFNILMVTVIWGLLGAKVFDVIEHLDDFFRDPLGTFFSFSGLAFYGGLIGGTIGAYFYTKRKKMHFIELVDSVAPALMFAYFVGRMGCQLSGDGCWGEANILPQPEWLSFLPAWTWAYDFPHNVINEGGLIPHCCSNNCHILDQPVWPTSLYESSMALVFFTILWSIRKRVTKPLMLTSLFLIMNGSARFLIETIRINIEYNVLGIQLTQAQIISSLIVLTGIVLFFLSYKGKIKLATNHPTPS